MFFGTILVPDRFDSARTRGGGRRRPSVAEVPPGRCRVAIREAMHELNGGMTPVDAPSARRRRPSTGERVPRRTSGTAPLARAGTILGARPAASPPGSVPPRSAASQSPGWPHRRATAHPAGPQPSLLRPPTGDPPPRRDADVRMSRIFLHPETFEGILMSMAWLPGSSSGSHTQRRPRGQASSFTRSFFHQTGRFERSSSPSKARAEAE